jgi:ketosteroid isomerase-like protein
VSANVDLAKSLYAAWERGDWSSAEWAHPEIEYVIADGPAPGSWRGLSDLGEAWRGILSAWEDFRIEATEYRELDEERVLVLHRFSGRGKTSGLEIERMSPEGASLFHMRDGKVMKAVTYLERERAFADLGLPPKAGSTHS